jgi:hypothetical protein
MQKDFITATPDSGGSGSTTVTATAPANQTESARSTSLSVAGGGMTRTVGASQAAGVVTWNYYFSVTPTSLSFVAGGESKSVTVTSYRKKVINGVETSTQENVNYTVSVTGTGFSGSGTTVTAAANSATSTRTGTATYTQATSGKSQGVSLSQAAAAVIFKTSLLNNHLNILRDQADFQVKSNSNGRKLPITVTPDSSMFTTDVGEGFDDYDYTVSVIVVTPWVGSKSLSIKQSETNDTIRVILNRTGL